MEEGGNWQLDENGEIAASPDTTDIALAAHDYLSSGYLIKFGSGTSYAAPKVANLAARIQDRINTRNVDLLRAIIINSARWPADFGSIEDKLRVFGYGVPDPDRALNIGGSRSVILIEDSITIGNVHFYRIPWPADLFEQSPDLEIRVSITLAYRAPVRKGNRKYRGTVLEWKLSKRGESLEDFSRRSIYQGMAAISEDDDDNGDEEYSPIADWPWTVRVNLRKRGTAQKDWFEVPASYFGEELYLGVIGKRSWLSKTQQDQGWLQRYAIAICIEVLGQNIPLHERIEQLVQISVPVAVAAPGV